jgi:tricorn protease
MYFTTAAWDRAKLSKEEFALVKEREDKDKDKDKGKKEPEPKTATPKPAGTIAFDWDGLIDRKMRLTINTSAASDWVLSKDGEKLYYLASCEKGNHLWVTEARTRETKLFTKLGANTASMELSPDGKFLFVVGDGKAIKVDAESGKSEPIAVNTEMVLGYSAEGVHLRPQLAPVQTEAGIPRSLERRLGRLLQDLQEVPPSHQQQLGLR